MVWWLPSPAWARFNTLCLESVRFTASESVSALGSHFSLLVKIPWVVSNLIKIQDFFKLALIFQQIHKENDEARFQEVLISGSGEPLEIEVNPRKINRTGTACVRLSGSKQFCPTGQSHCAKVAIGGPLVEEGGVFSQKERWIKNYAVPF